MKFLKSVATSLREVLFVARHIYLTEQIAAELNWDPSWICGRCNRPLRRDGTCGVCDAPRR